MKTWNEIVQLFSVEEMLFNLVKESILAMQSQIVDDRITGFELFCNLKYGYVFLSINTASNHEKDRAYQPSVAVKQGVKDARSWTYYQFNTDTPGIREGWRSHWEKVQKFLSDDLYEEYLDFLNVDEAEANRRLAENEQALRQTVEKVFERIRMEVLQKTPGLEEAEAQVVFEENYY